jgi:hypothetical protein
MDIKSLILFFVIGVFLAVLWSFRARVRRKTLVAAIKYQWQSLAYEDKKELLLGHAFSEGLREGQSGFPETYELFLKVRSGQVEPTNRHLDELFESYIDELAILDPWGSAQEVKGLLESVDRWMKKQRSRDISH